MTSDPVLRVRALVCGLPDGKWERRRYLVLRGYIDDSGNREHSPVLVLGGWIAPVTTWLEFVPDWQAMLAMSPAIEYFKMNEAATLTGQFAHWSRERADERVALAYKTIERHIPYQVSCVVHLEPFYRLFTPDLFPRRMINPYYLAFTSIVSDVASQQQVHGINEEIDFIFDEQVMEWGKIADGWNDLRANASPETRHLIGSVPAFLDDRKFPPLQAADLLAWWVRRMVEGTAPQPRWRSSRVIPGFQMDYNEARLLEVRGNIISGASPSRSG